jgi:hypothetical protein
VTGLGQCCATGRALVADRLRWKWDGGRTGWGWSDLIWRFLAWVGMAMDVEGFMMGRLFFGVVHVMGGVGFNVDW